MLNVRTGIASAAGTPIDNVELKLKTRRAVEYVATVYAKDAAAAAAVKTKLADLTAVKNALAAAGAPAPTTVAAPAVVTPSYRQHAHCCTSCSAGPRNAAHGCFRDRPCHRYVSAAAELNGRANTSMLVRLCCASRSAGPRNAAHGCFRDRPCHRYVRAAELVL